MEGSTTQSLQSTGQHQQRQLGSKRSDVLCCVILALKHPVRLHNLHYRFLYNKAGKS